MQVKDGDLERVKLRSKKINPILLFTLNALKMFFIIYCESIKCHSIEIFCFRQKRKHIGQPDIKSKWRQHVCTTTAIKKGKRDQLALCKICTILYICYLKLLQYLCLRIQCYFLHDDTVHPRRTGIPLLCAQRFEKSCCITFASLRELLLFRGINSPNENKTPLLAFHCILLLI